MKNSNVKKEKNQGITLIALIVTIVVLLILAGVTISAISGNESVMEKAQEAKEKTDISNEKEAIQLAVVNVIAKTSNISEIDENELETELSDSTTSITKDGDHWDVTGNTGTEYIIKDDGTVLTIDELYEEMDSYVSVTGILTIEDASNNMVRITVNSSTKNQMYTMNTGTIFYRGTNLPKDLLIENADENEIRYFSFDGNSFTGYFKDSRGGFYIRAVAKIQYGNHTHVKYGEVIHTTIEELSKSK